MFFFESYNHCESSSGCQGKKLTQRKPGKDADVTIYAGMLTGSLLTRLPQRRFRLSTGRLDGAVCPVSETRDSIQTQITLQHNPGLSRFFFNKDNSSFFHFVIRYYLLLLSCLDTVSVSDALLRTNKIIKLINFPHLMLYPVQCRAWRIQQNTNRSLFSSVRINTEYQ